MRLKTLLGDYPGTLPLKRGEVVSSKVKLDFADVKVPHTAFKRVVRDLEFDLAELAIMTFLLAREHGKPLLLLPVVLTARFQHPYLVYNAARGPLAPQDLAGKRIAIRSWSVTTAVWLRDVLEQDCGVKPTTVGWVTFEEPHVAEVRDPPHAERAPAGKDPLGMLMEGEVDAAVLGGEPPSDPRIKPVFADPAAAAEAWRAKHGTIQINHMVVVKESAAEAAPEVLRVLAESKRLAGLAPEVMPVGAQAVASALQAAIDCAHRQGLVSRPVVAKSLLAL